MNRLRITTVSLLFGALALSLFWLLPETFGGGAARKARPSARFAVNIPDSHESATIRASSSKRKPKPKPPTPKPAPAVGSKYVIMAYNDLGMHCMNPTFGEFCLLPPFNTVRATVIQRGEEPKIISSSSSLKVNYFLPGNTVSSIKTDFWDYSLKLFGVNLPANIGLTGNGLTGFMVPLRAEKQWEASGIPVTDRMDPVNGNPPEINPFPLATVELRDAKTDAIQAWTKTVVPVSTEMACNTCHNTPGMTVESDILTDHDRLHGTNLMNSKPVLCASCHADPALGAPGKPGIPSMSHAMHGAHAPRMQEIRLTGANTCYTCHPGNRTQCQRDIHSAKGMSCVDCHGDEFAVANVNRKPWVDEPSCASCHKSRKPKFDFEEPGKLFRNSRGHGGVACAVCHGSPHAITPTVTEADNVQANLLQGFSGVIRDCKVCHIKTPGDKFFHKIDD